TGQQHFTSALTCLPAPSITLGMRRTSRLAALALAFACSRPAPAPDPLTLLPGDASLVAHVDLRALQAAPLWQHNRSLLDADPDARRTLEALARCQLPFEGLRSLDLAVS